MPSISVYSPSAIARYVAATIMSTVLLIYSGASAPNVTFLITKQTPTAASRLLDMFVVKSLSGTGIAVDGNAQIRGSGGLLVNKNITGATLEAVRSISGATLTLSAFGAAPTFKVFCPKADGVVGTMTVTATGTVLKTCN